MKTDIDKKSAALPSYVAGSSIAECAAPRRIAYRTRGYGHGPIVRLMSPSDLGQVLKPFVFLDIIDMGQEPLRAMARGGGMPIHPHSGLATVAVYPICLASPDGGAPRPGAKTELACDLQLPLASALHGLPMERTADRNRCGRMSGNSLQPY